MAAAAGAGAGITAVSTILDDLVSAFKTVFNNIYRFAKPGWVITFAAGAPIALYYIDEGIKTASNIATKWADTLYSVASNIYEEVYKWVENKIGSGLFQSVAATIAAALASAPIWLAAIIMQYVIQPLVGTILEALKQIFGAVYDFVCKVLVPVVKVSIMAYVDYYAVKGVYRYMHNVIASWFSANAFKAMGKTLALFAMPLASGFFAWHMYEHILNVTGACGRSVTIQMPGAPAITPATSTKRTDVKITVTESLSASILQTGAAPPPSPYVVSVSESLSAVIQAIVPSATTFIYEVNVNESLSAEIKSTRYVVNVTDSISAEIKGPTIQTLAQGTADVLGVATVDVTETFTYTVNVSESLSAEISGTAIQTVAQGTADVLGIATIQTVTAQTIAQGTADVLGIATVQTVTAQALAQGTADVLGIATIQTVTAQALGQGTADVLGIATIQVTTGNTADLLLVATTQVTSQATGTTTGSADVLGTATTTVQ